MARAKKEAALTPEERLQAALVPDWEWPHKLPENWCWVYAPHIFDIEYGKSLPTKQLSDTGYPVFGANGQIGFYSEYMYKQPQALMSCRGAYSGTMNKSLPYSYVTSNSLIISSPRGLMGTDCIYYLFSALNVSELISGTAQPQVTVQAFDGFPIPLSPLAEQQRIVERIESLFAKLDEAKEKAQAVVDSFETRKATILHKAFTGELTAKWREEHGVGMESWEQCSISDVCTVNPKKADTKDLPDELEVSFFPMPALSEIYGEITDPQTRLLKEVRSGFTNFSEGDVVFAKITPCMENGKSAVVGKLVNDIGYGTTEFFVLRCSDRLYNRFLYHLVRDKLFRDKAKAVMAGAVGQQRVPKRYLETYKLNLPKFNEQLEIVRILDGSFAKEQQAKEAAEAVLEQIDLMKKSILTRAFRGELGTNDPSEESAVELLKQIF
ncbi:restriction endonuclease subunit S [Ruminococcus sp.]|jgi:type I restriction enzyme S subunit|uniref:restriction endonuclease subunit S n=1 Tax=Ruminococcus sp. TaxID=41978 RepID=UPI0025E27985|nr:restriction endonuclease subunit S [Ruminococcus sp.]